MSTPGYPTHPQIHLWIQDVVRETRQRPPSLNDSVHGMRLRPRTNKPQIRQPLRETTGNNRLRKRPREAEGPQLEARRWTKQRRAMCDDQVPKKKRGRPPKNKVPDESTTLDLTNCPNLQLRHRTQGPSSASSPARTPSPGKGASPTRTKKSVPSLNYAKPDAALAMTDLESCRPQVFQMDVECARKSGPVPPAVEALYKTLTSVKYACIPPDLKASYHKDTDTPQKSRDPPPDEQFLPSTAKQYPAERSWRMKQSVDMINKDAGWNHRSKAHERNWGKLVSNILFDYEIFQPDIVAVNVETCTIAPQEIRLTSSSGEPIAVEKSVTDADNDNSTTPIGRMIDWVLALRLNHNDTKVISDAFSTLQYAKRSLNQSLTDFLRKCPIFLDIELKKELSARDPEVQLAVWASAGLRKKQLMQWSTGLPMPGIVVDGHMWTGYLFFEQNQHVIMLGPIQMGTTSTPRGTWEIYYQLMHLVEWGTVEYRAWFEKEVLGWAKSRLALPAVDDEDD
ncbi:MAG: hypothetical protein Q9225_007184 [Loekoesia sp. 1 TL-2023]